MAGRCFMRLLLLPTALALVFHQTPSANPANSSLNCPQMPRNKQEWQKSYLWAVFIDGKDARKGPHVYDWDNKFFDKVSSEMSKIYSMEHTPAGTGPLTLDLVEKFRKKVYPCSGMDEKQLEKGTGCPLMYGKADDKAGNGIMPRCTNLMQCEDVKALLQNIPRKLYSYKNEGPEPGCPKGLKASPGKDKRSVLKHLLTVYNTAVAAERSGENRKEELLSILVTFARSFAFLHPFLNGNGRLRNVILQRELRRLGIACGTMMYNYNKDAFVDGFPRYLGKVRDGIEKFELGLGMGKNPWLNATFVAEHEKKFETISGLEKCAADKKMGSGGTINLDRGTEE